MLESSKVTNLEDTLVSAANSVRSKQAYKEMPDCFYYTLTLSIYLLCLVLSILVSDIGVIFQFIAAIAYSNIGFICPGLFFLMA